MLNPLKYIGEIGGIFGALMISTNTPISGYGYIFFTASSAAWVIAAWKMQEWQLCRMSMIFTAINIFGLYRWLF